MKVVVTNTEVDIEVEKDEMIEWVSQGGNHLHVKLIRGEPYEIPFHDYDSTTNSTVNAHEFDGVTPGMEQK